MTQNNIDLSHPIATGRTAEVYPWGEDCILKLYREWAPAGWVEHEAKIAAAVDASGVPAPKAGEMVDVQGRRGLVYQKIQGRSMLEEMQVHLTRLPGYAKLLARLHAQMHEKPAPGLPPQHEQLQRILDETPYISDSERAGLLSLLETLPRGERLCHGDFHPHNVLMSPTGPVIIDWMTAVSGTPGADVARTVLLLTVTDTEGSPVNNMLLLAGRKLFGKAYLDEYRKLAPQNLAHYHAWRTIMAAARLNEKIPPEKDRLLKIVREGLK